MTNEIIFQFALLTGVVALFASDRVRPDAVAIGLILVLMISGQLTVGEALSGFSNPLVLMIAGLFVVGEGLSRTGIAHAMGGLLIRRAGTSEVRLIVSLMAVVALLSAFMSSTGAVAVFIPVTLTLARRAGLPPSKLLMPVSVASLLGGMLTLIGTPPNLVVSEELENLGLDGFGFFDFAPVGLVVLVAGIAAMVLFGRRQLPGKTTDDDAHIEPTMSELVDRYGTLESGGSYLVPASSPLIGKTPGTLHLKSEWGLTLLAVQRQRVFRQEPLPASPDIVLRQGDLLHLLGDDRAATAFASSHGLRPGGNLEDHADVVIQELGLAEVLIPPGSRLAGQTPMESNIRSRRGLTVVAVQRRGETLPGDAARQILAEGDTMLVAAGWRQLHALPRLDRDILALNLPQEIADASPARPRAPQALLILLVMLVLMTLKIVPAVTAVMLAGLAMVAARCVPPNVAYRCINWSSLVLIAGMLPLSTALEQSGALTLVVDGMVDLLGGLGPIAMMAGIFLLTSVFSQFISNTATCVLVAPIAALMAQQMGLSPRPFLMVVALAASAAFLTPVASPVNTLVMGPGGYRFKDFLKVGFPLILIVLAAALFLVPLVFPLT